MTPTERHVKAMLRRMEVRAYPQEIFFLDANHYRIVDFYIPQPNPICLELDGSSHESPEIMSYDKWKDEKLIARHRRFRVLRFRNDEVWQPSFYLRLQNELGFGNGSYITQTVVVQRPKWRNGKPNAFWKKRSEYNSESRTLNLGWSIVMKCRARERRNKYKGLTFQPGYSLEEMRRNGWL